LFFNHLEKVSLRDGCTKMMQLSEFSLGRPRGIEFGCERVFVLEPPDTMKRRLQSESSLTSPTVTHAGAPSSDPAALPAVQGRNTLQIP
jgi:hypothetical protein